MKSSERLSDLRGGAGPGFLLVKDNAMPDFMQPESVGSSLDDEGVDATDWLSWSPDLNLTEHLLDVT